MIKYSMVETCQSSNIDKENDFHMKNLIGWKNHGWDSILRLLSITKFAP